MKYLFFILLPIQLYGQFPLQEIEFTIKTGDGPKKMELLYAENPVLDNWILWFDNLYYFGDVNPLTIRDELLSENGIEYRMTTFTVYTEEDGYVDYFVTEMISETNMRGIFAKLHKENEFGFIILELKRIDIPESY